MARYPVDSKAGGKQLELNTGETIDPPLHTEPPLSWAQEFEKAASAGLPGASSSRFRPLPLELARRQR